MEAAIARGIQALIALSGAYLVALWFVLVVWTFRDIEARSRSVVTQVFSTLLAVLFFIPGALLYLILRPKETLDEAFQRSLEEEYLLQDLEELPLCPACHRYVEDDYRLCPHCQTQLREPCVACARLVDLRWALCPYCGAVQTGKPATERQPAAEELAARWTSPAVRRRRAAAAAEERVAALMRQPAAEAPVATTEAIPAAQPVALEVAPVADAPTPLRPFDRKRTRAMAWRRATRESVVRREAEVESLPNGNGRGHDAAALAQNGSGLLDGYVSGPGLPRNGRANGHTPDGASLPAKNGTGEAEPEPTKEPVPIHGRVIGGE